MAPVFVIPTSLRDLEAPAENGERLYAQEVAEVENLSAYEVNDLVKGTRAQDNSAKYWLENIMSGRIKAPSELEG